MQANVKCISCMYDKQVKLVGKFADADRKNAYLQGVQAILDEFGSGESAPKLSERINNLYKDFWKIDDEYAEVKQKYNRLLLDIEDDLIVKIRHSDDTVKECIKYVCAANYIDYSAVKNVNEETFAMIMDKAGKENIPDAKIERFRNDLAKAKTLVYLTDNCGEAVVDKIFIKFIKENYPDLQITVILRGENTLNDATLQDAEAIGLTSVATCIGNGNGAPGTVIDRFSKEAKDYMDHADVIIAKGQGNFEGLFGEGYNPYYLFLCKCDLFVDRFGLARYSSVFEKEDSIRMFHR